MGTGRIQKGKTRNPQNGKGCRTAGGKMARIKLCGMSRMEDIAAVNEIRPEFCGFVIEVPKSRRNVSAVQAERLSAALAPGIVPVGVFVNAEVSLVADLLNRGVIGAAQLHGQEDASYVEAVKEQTGRPVVQAFSIRTQEDVQRAFASPADYILLDQGGGGTGRTFDWSLLERSKAAENKTPFFLAGGLGVDNLEEAIRRTRPFAVDLSSSLETDGRKDAGKIREAVRIVRA